MENKTNGGPAFPGFIDRFHDDHPERILEPVAGMTMRQAYKMAAMTGLLSSESDNLHFQSTKELVKAAAGYADAMIAEDKEHAK